MLLLPWPQAALLISTVQRQTANGRKPPLAYYLSCSPAPSWTAHASAPLEPVGQTLSGLLAYASRSGSAGSRRGLCGQEIGPRPTTGCIHAMHGGPLPGIRALMLPQSTVRQIGGWRRGTLSPDGDSAREILPTARAVCDCVIELAHLYSVTASCQFILPH